MKAIYSGTLMSLHLGVGSYWGWTHTALTQEWSYTKGQVYTITSWTAVFAIS